MKRQRSPDNSTEGGRSVQKRKVLLSRTQESQTGQSSRARPKLVIWTSLASRRKAELNDPRPIEPVPPLPDTGANVGSDLTNSAGRVGISVDASEGQAPSGALPGVVANAEEAAQHPKTVDARRGQALTEESLGEDDDASKDEDGGRSEDFVFQLWLEDIGGYAVWQPLESTSPPTTRSKIARCEARLIRRDKMRASFWSELEKLSQETSDLAFNLFDRYGRLDREYYEHDFRKGTGVWGKELDRGDLLLFESLEVGYQWRRRGIGRQVVDAILKRTREKVDEKAGFYAVVRPGYLMAEFDGSEDFEAFAEREIKISQSFWRSLGFRRIGTSSWFARTDSPDHPSRHLDPEQDWQQPDDIGIQLPKGLEELFLKLADPATEEKECVDELEQNFSNDPEDHQWLAVNEKGNTALHIAAMSQKPKLVKFILSKASQLAAVRNKQGYTPEEALRNQLEHQRTRERDGQRLFVASDEFKGFGEPAIECIAALKGTDAFDLSTLSTLDIEAASSATDDQVRRVPHIDIAGIRNTLRLMYGCTCGKCVGGFLSPRMIFALLSTAEIQYGLLDHDIYESSGPDWVEDNEEFLIYLPPHVRDNLETNKSMRQGFTNMFSHLAECLRRNNIPSEHTVLVALQPHRSEWPPVTKHFLQRGGSVEAVANILFEKTMEADEWAGDGSHREGFGEKIDELPECRNDHEFGFVRAMCGYAEDDMDSPFY